MLDERKVAILRAVVEEYVSTAQPVGSSHIARSRAISVSPATVRNDMLDYALEIEYFDQQLGKMLDLLIQMSRGLSIHTQIIAHPAKPDAAFKRSAIQIPEGTVGALPAPLIGQRRILYTVYSGHCTSNV